MYNMSYEYSTFCFTRGVQPNQQLQIPANVSTELNSIMKQSQMYLARVSTLDHMLDILTMPHFDSMVAAERNKQTPQPCFRGRTKP